MPDASPDHDIVVVMVVFFVVVIFMKVDEREFIKEIERLRVLAWCLAWKSLCWAWFVFDYDFEVCSAGKGKFWRKKCYIPFDARPSDYLFIEISTQTKIKTMANTRPWPRPWSRPRPRPKKLFTCSCNETGVHPSTALNGGTSVVRPRALALWLVGLIFCIIFYLLVKFSPCD